MAYVKNADLTIEHVLSIVKRLNYECIAGYDGAYVLVVCTPENEIFGFKDLAHARRFLVWCLKHS